LLYQINLLPLHKINFYLYQLKMAKAPKQYGSAVVQPTTLNREERTVDVVFATETCIPRYGWSESYDEVLSCNEANMRMERVNTGLPVVNSHNDFSIFNQLGRTSKVWVNDKKECCATLHFSKRKEVDDLFTDIADGIICNISVGYRVFKFEREPQAEGKNPIYRATDWMPCEISLVAVPADINSGIRSSDNDTHECEIININPQQQRTMSKKTRKDYEVVDEAVKEGDEVVLDEVTYIALSDGEVGDTIEVEARSIDGVQTRSAGGTIPKVVPAPDVAQIRSAATADERARFDSILTATRAAKLSDSDAVDWYKSGKTLDECRAAIIDKLVAAQPNIDGHHGEGIRTGEEAIDKKRAAITDAILHRVNGSVFKLKEGNEYRGMSLVEVARDLLQERGTNTRGMDKLRVADLVFKRSHSTSDFPLLFEGIIDKKK
jgi:hypothetical protein